jgi:hypothetical protein
MQVQLYDTKATKGYDDKHCEREVYIDMRGSRKNARWQPRNERKPFEGKWVIERTSRRRSDLASPGVFVVEDRFLQLAKTWKRETAMFSVVRDKIINPNYLEIIGLGRTFKDTVLKLILKDLQKGEEFWHYALKSIADENPVPKGMVNNLSIVRDCWLKWGEGQHLI